MTIDKTLLSDDEAALFKTLVSLADKLDADTRKRYRRINPFTENLFDWRVRGTELAGENVVLFPSVTLIGDVAIGRDCWVGPDCMLDGSGGLTIGKGVTLATGVIIYTHDTSRNTVSAGLAPYEYASVAVGDHAFVSTRAIVLPGVTIGCHALVGANSLVTKNVGDYEIVAGSPAKAIGTVVLNEDGVKYRYHTT